jgi:hypothetical protein
MPPGCPMPGDPKPPPIGDPSPGPLPGAGAPNPRFGDEPKFGDEPILPIPGREGASGAPRLATGRKGAPGAPKLGDDTPMPKLPRPMPKLPRPMPKLPPPMPPPIMPPGAGRLEIGAPPPPIPGRTAAGPAAEAATPRYPSRSRVCVISSFTVAYFVMSSVSLSSSAHWPLMLLIMKWSSSLVCELNLERANAPALELLRTRNTLPPAPLNLASASPRVASGKNQLGSPWTLSDGSG